MGNVAIFARAFRECGIGGRFSKYQLVGQDEWIELFHIENLQPPKFCFRIHNQINLKRFKQISAGDARLLHDGQTEWLSHFMTAQKTIARIVGRKPGGSENKYYYDHLNDSVVITNRMFVIEVTPAMRSVMEVETNAVIGFLDLHAHRKVGADDDLQVHARCGKVVINFNGLIYNTLQTVENFNSSYGIN